MNISIIAFTEQGAKKARQIKEIVKEHTFELFGKPQREGLTEVEGSLSEWSEEQFQKKEAILFIGATGIAVRAIATALKDKLTDPAVIVIDELGHFIIPLLSGHVGGANALASELADRLCATAVITTATDLSGVFAVDVFAKKNHLRLDARRRKAYKDISAALLSGESIGIWLDPGITYHGVMPEGLKLLDDRAWKQCLYKKPEYPYVIAVTEEALPEKDWLIPLVPAYYTLGIGCKKNTSVDAMHKALQEFLEQNKLSVFSIKALASIDLKQWEPAILSLTERMEIPFHVYSADTLMEIEGVFTASDFVKKVTGVDNVCERAAMAAILENEEEGRIYCQKTSFGGITFALAQGIEDRRICFG